MMEVAVIYWTAKEMYHAGFDPDTGALWTKHKYGGYLIENLDQQARHMQVLSRIEGIPFNELTIKEVEEC